MNYFFRQTGCASGKRRLLIRLLLLCILCAGVAGCESEEEPVLFSQPETMPGRVRQIREISSGYRGTHEFTYDEQGRVVTYTRTDTLGKIVNKFYQKYIFRGNAATVTRRYDESATLYLVARLHLNGSRHTTSVDMQEMSKRMYYNADGYFIEKQSNEGWVEYLYTPAGEGFNLGECNVYEQRIGNMEQRPASTEKRTYSEVANNLNIDLTYLLTGTAPDLYDRDLALSMFDMLGRRSTNLPDTRDVTDYTTDGVVEHSYVYAYQFDNEGYVTQVEVTQQPEGYLTTYRISCQK